MAGHFEVIDDADGGCRARLIDESGNVLALSDRYGDKDAAARGIRAIREIAGTGLIDDGRETSTRG
jgi:uncharacterized protein